jgi:hypothetical protein
VVDSGVLERIQKIRALAEHGTAGEMENAAAKLSQLLLKHNLTIESLDMAGDSLSGCVGYSIYHNGTSVVSWRAELMWQISKHHFCRTISYVNPQTGSPVWVIVGRPDNQEVVKEMYSWLEEEIARLGAKALAEAKVTMPKVGPEPENFVQYLRYIRDYDEAMQLWDLAHEDPTKWVESWRLGAVRGIQDAFERERRSAEKENKDNWAIVPLLEEEVDNFIKENFRTQQVKKVRKGDTAVYEKGREIGRNLTRREIDSGSEATTEDHRSLESGN